MQWHLAADFKGDFQVGSVRTFEWMTYFRLAMQRLEILQVKAAAVLRQLLKFAAELATADAKLEYFATSLPTMLLFDDDLQQRQRTTAEFIEAQAQAGLGNIAKGRRLLREVLLRDPNHALASDLFAELATRSKK